MFFLYIGPGTGSAATGANSVNVFAYMLVGVFVVLSLSIMADSLLRLVQGVLGTATSLRPTASPTTLMSLRGGGGSRGVY